MFIEVKTNQIKVLLNSEKEKKEVDCNVIIYFY